MVLFNRVFRAASGVFMSVFAAETADAPAIPLYLPALGPDAPLAVDNPMPSADLADDVAQGVTDVTQGEAETIFVATPGVRYGRRLFNRGGGDATVVVGGDAAGLDSERKFAAGAEIVFPYRTGLKVSVFAEADTSIEWEQWT